MTDKNQNFDMMAGDDVELNFTISSDIALTLTGASIRWWVARSVGAGPARAVVMKSLVSGIAVTDADNRLFTVTLNAADTDGLKGFYYHECEIIDAAGKISTVTTGKMTVNPTIIR